MGEIAQSLLDLVLEGGPIVLILGAAIVFIFALYNIGKDYFTEGQTGRGLLSKLGEAVIVPALLAGGSAALAIIPGLGG